MNEIDKSEAICSAVPEVLKTEVKSDHTSQKKKSNQYIENHQS